jgi:rod shape-determining protein MreC
LAVAWWRNYRWECRLLLLFFIMLLAWLLVPAILRSRLRIVCQELQAPIWSATAEIHGVATRAVLLAQPKEVLARRIVELSRMAALGHIMDRVDAAEGWIRLGHEGRRDDWGKFAITYARVLRRDEKAWWKELLLDAGGGSGAGNGQAVICGDHLAGRIWTVSPWHSVAILATDPRFRVVAHIAGDSRPVIYKGVSHQGFGQPIGRITHVPMDVAVEVDHPLNIVTSSLSGTYPDGIPIGRVSHLHPSGDGIFQEGTVNLAPYLLHCREVGILRPMVGNDGGNGN